MIWNSEEAILYDNNSLIFFKFVDSKHQKVEFIIDLLICNESLMTFEYKYLSLLTYLMIPASAHPTLVSPFFLETTNLNRQTLQWVY